jgi:hypothetical protein
LVVHFNGIKVKLKCPTKQQKCRHSRRHWNASIKGSTYYVYSLVPKGKRFTSENVGYTSVKLFYYTHVSHGAASTPPPWYYNNSWIASRRVMIMIYLVITCIIRYIIILCTMIAVAIQHENHAVHKRELPNLTYTISREDMCIHASW